MTRRRWTVAPPGFFKNQADALLASEQAAVHGAELLEDTLPPMAKAMLGNDDRIKQQLSDRAYLVLTQLIARGDLDRSLRSRLTDLVIDGLAIEGMSEATLAKVHQRVLAVAEQVVEETVEATLADLVKTAKQSALKAVAEALRRVSEGG